MIRQYDIYIVSLDPTLGAEMQKSRPCVVISPDEMNRQLLTVQIAPMTTNLTRYPWRVPLAFRGKKGMIALDQVRTVDRRRLHKKIGRARSDTIKLIKLVLQEMLVD